MNRERSLCAVIFALGLIFLFIDHFAHVSSLALQLHWIASLFSVCLLLSCSLMFDCLANLINVDDGQTIDLCVFICSTPDHTTTGIDLVIIKGKLIILHLCITLHELMGCPSIEIANSWCTRWPVVPHCASWAHNRLMLVNCVCTAFHCPDEIYYLHRSILSVSLGGREYSINAPLKCSCARLSGADVALTPLGRDWCLHSSTCDPFQLWQRAPPCVLHPLTASIYGLLLAN